MNFVAVDVETANADMASICQIGVARFIDGKLTDEWSSLIDPEDHFDSINISIHKIEPGMVRGKPKLPDIAGVLRNHLEPIISVCHTHFDRVAIARAFLKYDLPPVTATWLDSARVVRRTWKDLAWSGYGLINTCDRIGYRFKPHDALEDAKAAGYVLLAAIQESKLGIDEWVDRVKRPIDPSQSVIQREGNPEGAFFGDVIVFTGALEMLRSEAADMAAHIGFQVADNVTKKTTTLVVGDQDISRLAGHAKSSKHRKAEQLAAEGQAIRILRETDFKVLAKSAVSDMT